MVIPVCGTTSFLGRALSDVLGRAFAGFRLVLVSSYSGSGALRVTGSFSSPHVCVIGGRGGLKTKYAQGGNVGLTRSACVTFYSTSSVVFPGELRRRCGFVRRRPSVSVYNDFMGLVGRRNSVANGFAFPMGRSGVTIRVFLHYTFRRSATFVQHRSFGRSKLRCGRGRCTRSCSL